jgi:curved DNA-binding protein CbpA
VPRLRADADFGSLSLEPADGYILSQIDGATPVEEIGLLTGLGASRVQTLVDKLDAHGAIEWVEAPVGATQAPDKRDRPRKAKRPPVEPIVVAPQKKLEPGQLYDPAELDEPDVDIGPVRRKFILDTFYRLEELTFYELLDVDPDADKADIRGAYFKLSKAFHPDTMFGKRLGAFKRKMEEVFKRLTEAYEVLGKKKRRQEYDVYIALRLKTLRAEREIERGRRTAEAMAAEAAAQALEAPLEEPAAEPADEASEPPPSSVAPLEPTPSQPASSVAPSMPTSSPPPDSAAESRPAPQSERPSDRASGPASRVTSPPAASRTDAERVATRRQLMARKLAAASGRSVPGHSSIPPARRTPAGGSKKQVLRSLASSLKATAEFTGGVDLAQRYVEQAKRQDEEGDRVAAANSLRLAVALAPDRRDIADLHAEMAFEVAKGLAETYIAQANYEENNHKWADAGLSWAKVCEGRPREVLPHVKAALCMVRASGDLRRAKDFAQRAVDLDPDNFDAQKTLGLVFHAAGMAKNARRALEAAYALDSRDEMVENLLRELKK